MNYEEQVEAVKQSTANDPKLQKRLLEILEIERLYDDPKDYETKMQELNAIIRKSVDEDYPTLADKKAFNRTLDDIKNKWMLKHTVDSAVKSLEEDEL